MTRVVASEHAPDFIGFKNVPAVASLASAQWTAEAAPHNATITGVFAAVSGSALLLDVTAEAEREPDGVVGLSLPKF